MDLWRTNGGRWVDGMQALVAGLGCGACFGDGQDWLASQVFQDCPCVWVVVGSCAGFPGGLAVSWYFLVPRWCLWPLPCMLAGPSLPLLAFPPCPVHVTAYVTFPWLGMSWPHFMWVSSPGLCWVVVSLGGAVPLEP